MSAKQQHTHYEYYMLFEVAACGEVLPARIPITMPGRDRECAGATRCAFHTSQEPPTKRPSCRRWKKETIDGRRTMSLSKIDGVVQERKQYVQIGDCIAQLRIHTWQVAQCRAKWRCSGVLRKGACSSEVWRIPSSWRQAVVGVILDKMTRSRL